MVSNNGQPTRKTFWKRLFYIMMFPVVIILYFPMQIVKFFLKAKNYRKYRKAAYFALNNENYIPCFSDLYYCFRAAGLSRLDSAFNAVYMSKSEKLYRNDSPKAEKGVFVHPAGWYESEKARIERCADKFSLKLLNGISYVLMFPSKIFAKIKKSPLFIENVDKRYKGIFKAVKKSAYVWVPVTVAFVVSFAFALSSTTKVVIKAYIDDKLIGAVAQMETLDSTVEMIQANVSEVLDEEYQFSKEIIYEISEEIDPEYTDISTLYKNLFEHTLDIIGVGAGLYIDNELVAVCENAFAAERTINSILEIYKEKSGRTNVKISDSVRILEQYYPLDSIVSADSFETVFNTEFDYIAEGESAFASNNEIVLMSTNKFGEIANMAGGRTLREIPTALEEESVSVLDSYIPEINLVELPFETSQTIVYYTEIPYDCLIVEDSDYYTNYSAVDQKGINGSLKVTANVEYVNGYEVKRTIVSETVSVQAVPEIKRVGSKLFPENMGLNTDKIFIMPYESYISDYFGPRTLRGEYNYHRGIDIPGPKGTPLAASASGTVIVAMNNHYSYGNYVVIDHGNGFTTYYAHMSKLLVEVGDTVSQGDTIGLIGSTGDSTGNHVHFEIRKNGTHVDPMKYIYKEK